MKFLLFFFTFIWLHSQASATIFPPLPSEEMPEKNGCMMSCDATYEYDFDICNYLPDGEGWKECHERANLQWQRCYELCDE